MPTIEFRIMSPADQREAIVQDFHALINATEGAVEAEVSVSVGVSDQPVDSQLAQMWEEDFGGDAEPATIRVLVSRNDLGSLSHLTMHFAELLTVREEKPPAEPLLRQIQDDAGHPRVPWHVDVRP